MAAYRFHERFVPAIAAGLKRQTIRPLRRGHSAHVEPGHQVILMDSRRGRRLGTALCTEARPVRLDFAGDRVLRYMPGRPDDVLFEESRIVDRAGLDRFAVADGFANWDDLEAWFTMTYRATTFQGILIRWEAFTPA